MNKFSRTARSVTFAAIVGLSLGVSAPGAFALDGESPVVNAPEVAPGVDNPNSPLVNPSKKGSLTVYKYIGETGTPTGKQTGTAVDSQSINEGFKGFEATFTIYKIKQTIDGKKIDLTTNDGLVAAAGIKASDYVNGQNIKPGLEGATLEQVKTGVTKGGMLEVGKNLDLAPYLIVEQQPAPYVDEAGQTINVDPAVPFIAFVPMTEGSADQGQGVKWNYDVRAFPKNYKTPGPTKEVADKDQNADSKALTYTIQSTVRQLNTIDGVQEKLKVFKITDQIDERLTVTGVKVFADGQEVTDSKGVKKSTNPVESGKTSVVVDFTGEALAQLKSGSKVKVEITTTVKELKASSEKIPNQARVFENRPGQDQDAVITPKPTDHVYSFWGGVEFTKVDKDGTGLEGAQFKIVRVANQGKLTDQNQDTVCASVNTHDAAWIDENDVTGTQNGENTDTFKSPEGGKVTITGLHVNDFENNAVVSERERSVYCLVEIKAPKGKELLSKAIPFQLATSDDKVTGNQKNGDYNRAYELATVTVGDKGAGKVVNLDSTTPNLPMTGGAGVGILAAIGAAIIGAGAWFARRNSAEA
ncbi:isopeptide-forming domain-containing fimbrial protein [Corynebacterium diphtheriae]|nr:isopeptide-forming domain-containing fimbrial protein [Corynebacterium diphtheriae]